MPLSSLKNVLHVEDEFLIAFDVDTFLSDAGVATITHATTCLDALDLIDRIQFDAAILDVAVTDGDTETVAKRLTELGIPYIYFTGFPDNLHEGEVGVLGKPATDSAIINAMKQLLQKPVMKRAAAAE